MYPDVDLFGKIVIGDNCVIGSHCIILPNTSIGANCIVGAGSVVRGKIPDESVIFGNPAKVVMKTPLAKKMLRNHKHCLKTKRLDKNKKMDMVREHFNISRYD
jgi:acetyltransferase-like isoleucine patch superfamily enzyme